MNSACQPNHTSVFVICDNEAFYACHLQEFLNTDERITCPVSVYTSTDLLLERQDPAAAQLLIIAESAFREEIPEAGFARILILNETNRLLSCGWPNISKYQSIDHILSAILEAAGEIDDEGGQTIRHAGRMHWIGFYTPINRCLQTTLALTMGQILGERGKVLYLNFERWPALSPLMESEPTGNIAELLYFNDCAREKVGTRLSRIVRHEGNIDIVMPCADFMQLQKVSAQQWVSLLETIRQVSEYEYLLLDLSDAVQGLLEILGHCERIYTILRQDEVGKEKIANYENLLRTRQVQELAAKTIFTELPVFPELPVRIADYDRGPLADYTRGELERANDTRVQEAGSRSANGAHPIL